MTHPITIISCGLGSFDLTDVQRSAVMDAEVLAGGRRLLDGFPSFKGETVMLAAHARDTVTQLVALAQTRRVAVLASGDALFFGIARLFLDQVPADQVRIMPNVTAAQHALARLTLPWEQARFFSVHGRATALPWPAVLRAPLAVIYADPAKTPGALARDLIRRYPAAADRPSAVVENLGAAEKVWRGTLADMAAVPAAGLALLVLEPATHPQQLPALSLGLADEVYAHERGLITHPEVRAVALSKLRLAPGVMWDLGAGSGSVGIEACGLCEGLAVYAVESQPDRCEQIRENAEQWGCPALHVREGSALAVIPDLPVPRAVFVGGGGAEASAIVEAALSRLLPGGRVVAAAVMVETQSALLRTAMERRVEGVEIGVRRAQALGPGHSLTPENPIMLLVWM